VGAKEAGVEPNSGNPLRYQPRILPSRDGSVGTAIADEEELTCLLAGGLDMGVDRLTVCSVNSNRTGCPVFLWRTIARSTACPCGATSSTFRLTTSQPRSLLPMAKLNIAKSRVRPSTLSFVRIDQTCFGRSGGFAPISLPLFQGVRERLFNRQASLAGMVVLLGY
jgi:hypothetical protein